MSDRAKRRSALFVETFHRYISAENCLQSSKNRFLPNYLVDINTIYLTHIARQNLYYGYQFTDINT